MIKDMISSGCSKKDIILYLEEENKELRKMVNTALNLSAEYTKDKKIINKELTRRIQKAIEYINNHQPVFELLSKEQLQEYFEKEYYMELLDILKGEK